MSPARPTLVHVGMPRTGTTSLQLNLLSRHPGACYLGKPQTKTREAVARVTRGLTYDPDLQPGPALEAFRRDHLEPLLQERDGPVVISEEEFATSTPTSPVQPQQIAERLHALLPDASILVTIRRQDHALPSLFGHMQRMGFFGPDDWGTFLEALAAVPRLAAAVDPAAVVQRYERLFGRERVHVLAFEQLVHDPGAYAEQVCRLAHLDPQEGRRLFVAGPVRNARPPGAREQLPARWRAWAAQRYASGNRYLAARTGLALEGWGYAV